jgi:transketolase C-terminal domain/subunit
VQRLGLQDVYVESGTNEDLLDIYRLSATRVAEQVRELLGRTP